MASVAQCDGSRRRFSKSASGIRDKTFQAPGLRQVTILQKTDWLRIQDEVNGVDKDKERLMEAAEHREALHLQSKQVVKLWPDTIAGQRQKMLEAKKIREKIEEEKRKQVDAEEAKYREEKQKEALSRARTQLYHQTDRVKGLHRALLHTEVLKEREAQTELKRRMKSATKDVEKKFLETLRSRDAEALRKEREKAEQKKLKRQAAAEDLKNQIKANELAREQHKLEIQKEAEEIQRLQERYQREQRMESERQANHRRSLMLSHLDHVSNRALRKEKEAQQQKAEEEQRNRFALAKDKMTKLRKEREKELFREAQQRRESILNKLTATQQEQAANEEQRIARALAEWDARQAQLQVEEERKKSEMLMSIAAHRELLRKQKEHLDKVAEQETRNALQAKREADRIHAQKQHLKVEKMREEQRKIYDFNLAQMAEKSARLRQMKEEEREFEAKNAKLGAEEESKFQQYSGQIIKAAAEDKRNLFPLYKAAREGIGGGQGPVFCGFRPSYLVHDSTGAQMPRYVSITTEGIKKLHEAGDIHEAKKRLGFTW